MRRSPGLRCPGGSHSRSTSALNPGGVFLNIFPSVGVLREGHCGVALAHWLVRYPSLLRVYLLVFRCLGFGYNKSGRSCHQWAQSAPQWLQEHTVYRTEREILSAYSNHFVATERAEHLLAAFRLEAAGWRRSARIAVRHKRLARMVVARLASMVLVARAI